jgi:phosphonate transport system substrate-binding protein
MLKSTRPLRALTYLAPSLPVELFELVCEHLADAIGRPIEMRAEDRHSGPMHGDHDPFASKGEDGVDLGFVCSPSYIYLRSKHTPSVELVPMGMVFEDMRISGRPVYFSEVVVREGHAASTFGDLEGCVWGVNDPNSLSGCFSAQQKLREIGRPEGFFAREVDTGSHLRSIEAILKRDIDAGAIDSNVLARLFHECPSVEDELRVVETWGPFPIQPLVIRAGLADELTDTIKDALEAMTSDPAMKCRLSSLGVLGFAPTSAEDYEEERCEMRALGLIA